MKGLVGFMLLVGVALVYWKWIVAIGAVIVVVYLIIKIGQQYEHQLAEKQKNAAELARRADQQHAWTMAGDGRGTYGAFPPAC